MNQLLSIPNHFNNTTTYVIGEICCNGCQVFHKDDAENVFRRFNVPALHQQQVYELFSQYNPNEPFSSSSLVECDRHTNSEVFTALVEHYNNHPEILNFLFNHKQLAYIITGMKYYSVEQHASCVDHPHPRVRVELAECCDKNLLDILVNDETAYVRAAVAKRCDKKLLDKLVNDDNFEVRKNVAKRGYKDHLDILVKDRLEFVRVEVAKHGNKDHLDILVKDESPLIRKWVATHGHKDHLDILVSDLDDNVRAEVARHGNNLHLDKLVKDQYMDVRSVVAKFGGKEHLEVLVSDPINFVAETAKQRLADM